MSIMSETALYGDNLPLESAMQEFSLSVDELKNGKCGYYGGVWSVTANRRKCQSTLTQGRGQNPTPQQHGVPTSKQTKLSRSIIVTAWE